MKEEKERIRGRSVDRLLDILDLFEKDGHELTIKDISHRIRAPKSSIYLLVELMRERGYLAARSSGRYQLGPRLGRLGNAFGRQATFSALAREALQELALRTRVVAELVVLEDWMQFVMFAAVSEASPYLKSPEGTRFPLPHTASARFLLRDVPSEVILKNIPSSHYNLPNGGIVDKEVFINEIRFCKDKAYYTTRGIVDPHLSCIAVPLLSSEKKCIASLSLVMPLTEIDERESELATAVIEAAQALNEKLDFLPVGSQRL